MLQEEGVLQEERGAAGGEGCHCAPKSHGSGHCLCLSQITGKVPSLTQHGCSHPMPPRPPRTLSLLPVSVPKRRSHLERRG